MNLFEKVEFEPKRADSATLVFLCAAVLTISFFVGSQAMGDYNEKISNMLRGGKVLAAEEKKIESAQENEKFEEIKVSKSLASAADSVKNSARKAKAQKAAKQKAAEDARLRSAPKPRAATKKVNGKRVCEKKNDKPHESGQGSHPHMDMECCPDPDEWPNPHCYYTPEQLSRMRKPPK